jgi:N-dimethylarginine dimethylaminohydrolase
MSETLLGARRHSRPAHGPAFQDQPCAVIVPPGRGMNDFLRPFVREELAAAPVDLEAARAEFDEYVEAFRQNGITVFLPHENDPLFEQWTHRAPDSVFPEDWVRPVFVPRNGRTVFLESSMTAHARREEPGVGVQTLRRLGILQRENHLVVANSTAGPRFEAGDVLQLYPDDGTPILLIGISSRTNWEAFKRLEELNREHQFGTLYAIEVFADRCLHLTTGAGVPGPRAVLFDKTLVNGAHLRKVRDIELLEVAQCDQGELNCPNVVWFPTTDNVLMDRRFPKTIRRVEQNRCTVIAVSNTEHAKGAGGLSCRSMRWNWHACSAALE